MRSFLLFCFMFITAQLFAQTQISGKVVDETGTPVIGANIYLLGAYDGASSDLKGHFSFDTYEAGEQTLKVEYLGYASQEAVVQLAGEPLSLDFGLEPAASDLATVTISAGAFEASDSKKSVTLRPLDIVTTAGALGDITGALQTLPGTQRVGEDGRLFVRGGAAHETRTFIDGLYAAQPYTSSTPNVPSRGRFNPMLFKGTTFSTGGYSAEFGQALSSALVLETQDLATESFTGLSLMSVGGNVSHTIAKENTSLAVSADYTDLSPYMQLVPQNLAWERAPNTLGGQAILRHRTQQGGLLKVQAQHHGSNFNLTTLNPSTLTDTLNVKLSNGYSLISASYQTGLGGDWTLRASAGYTLNKDRIRTIASIDESTETLLAKVRATRALGKSHVLRLGVSHWTERYREELLFEDFSQDQLMETPFTAMFAEADWKIADNLMARTGFRSEYDAVDGVVISPRLSLAYRTGANSQLSFASGRFRQRSEVNYRLVSPALGSEEAWHYILNWQYQRNGRTLRLEGYHKDYRQLSRWNTDGVPDVDGNGFARGIELFYRDKATIPNSDFWVSYGFLDTERQFAHFQQRVTPTFAARHSANLVYKYWIQRWQSMVGFTAAYTAPRPVYGPQGTQNVQSQTTPFRDLSINYSYLTQIKGNFTILYASVTNVPGFDNQFGEQFSQQPAADGTYPSITVRPPAKRFFFVGLFVSIGKQGL